MREQPFNVQTPEQKTIEESETGSIEDSRAQEFAESFDESPSRARKRRGVLDEGKKTDELSRVEETVKSSSKEEKQEALNNLQRTDPSYAIVVTNDSGDQLEYTYDELKDKGWTDTDFALVEQGDALSNVDKFSPKAKRMFTRQVTSKAQYFQKTTNRRAKITTDFLNQYYRGDLEPPPEVHQALAPLFGGIQQMDAQDRKKLVESQLLELELQERKRILQEYGVNMTGKELTKFQNDREETLAGIAKDSLELRMAAIDMAAQTDSKFMNNMKTGLELLNSITKDNIYESGGMFRDSLDRIRKKDPELYNRVVHPVLNSLTRITGLKGTEKEKKGDNPQYGTPMNEQYAEIFAAIGQLPSFQEAKSGSVEDLGIEFESEEERKKYQELEKRAGGY